jgi:hypothetical protein
MGSLCFGLDAALLAAGKPAGSFVRSVSSSLEHGSGSGETSLSCAQCSISSFVQYVTYCCWSEESADKGEQAVIAGISTDVGERLLLLYYWTCQIFMMLDIFSGFFDLENGNQKLKSDLKDLYINTAM